jgi:hypothetical protein
MPSGDTTYKLYSAVGLRRLGWYKIIPKVTYTLTQSDIGYLK